MTVSAGWPTWQSRLPMTRQLKVWELDEGRELLTLTGHAGGVSAVAVTPDGKLCGLGFRMTRR